ncbi:hypothetical protein DYB32_002456 [Aphanomyces invadans]|uniref:Protein kinase domain-containing protein n=1 Tax=Aphanomyces invadans TaxID=157072 RepID=A0A418B3C4_9STRA|nr:hypothetical protein DYB32_002456 [Aphanomyces invadans]
MSHKTPPPAPTSPARKAGSPIKAGAQWTPATPPLSPAKSPAKLVAAAPPSPRHRPTQTFESLYTLGRQLGEGRSTPSGHRRHLIVRLGNFSIVKECTLKATGETFAVKCIKKASLKKKDLANIHREMDILFKLEHPNIVKLVDVFDNEAGDMCYLVMELVTGGIAHRDLKPENLLYATTAADAAIKIADFGFAIIASEGVVMQTMCGTPGYFAPEVIAHRPYDFPSPYFDDISDLAKDFIRKMLVVDVESRLSADDVLAHPWLVDATANPTQAELDAMPQLRHVGTNLQNPGAIRAKFKRGINAVMALNKTGRLVASKKGKV